MNTHAPSLSPMSLDDLMSMRHPHNPKEHDLPALAESYARFGFVAFPTIDERSQVMVAGHGRCEALAMLRDAGAPPPANVTLREDGAWMVPCVRGLSFKNEKERDAYVVADNQHTIHGGWDMTSLAEMLRSFSDVGFQGLGFDTVDLRSFGFGDVRVMSDESEKPDVRKLEKKDPTEIPQDEIPDAPKVPITKKGDTWLLGESVLICDDCTQVDPARLRLGKLGFGFTSPPYNAGTKLYGKKIATVERYLEADDSMDADQYAELLRASTTLLLEACHVAAINIQSLAQNKRVIARWFARFADHLIDRAVWTKSNSAPAINRNVFNSAFEDIYIYANARRPKRTIETASFHGTVTNVHHGASAARDNDYSDVHGATMPIHLAQWAIETLGARADYVVDPFAGTGTTLIVASALGKRGAMVEMDPAYCDIIVERWTKSTGGEARRA